MTLRVPPGTQIFADDKETLIADLTEPGQRVLLAAGGNGGFGNARFKSSTNRAPRHANPGQEGTEMTDLAAAEADCRRRHCRPPERRQVDLSCRRQRGKAKVADYPFTTLYPELGVVKVGDTDFVVADIPGLIEGAHEGVGIGDRFLGHIERCRVILHLIDVNEEDVAEAYRVVRRELRAYGAGLEKKREIVALSKCDSVTPERAEEQAERLRKACRRKPVRLSALSKLNVDKVLRRIARGLGRDGEPDENEAAQADDLSSRWSPLD